jgi:hypothetical protein
LGQSEITKTTCFDVIPGDAGGALLLEEFRVVSRFEVWVGLAYCLDASFDGLGTGDTVATQLARQKLEDPLSERRAARNENGGVMPLAAEVVQCV